jgi:indole-3-glycerol phosphate synthase
VNILEEIIAHKRQEVALRKTQVSVKNLEKSHFFTKSICSLKSHLLNPAKTGIIAEFKRQSPSKGIINQQVSVADVTQKYVAAGASALSVLTDNLYFGGADEDLTLARSYNPETPLLRKDFMVDEFQILEARSLGADIILLIAANLSPAEVKKLAQFAQNLALEVLLEVHDAQELESSLNEFVDVVGVNNRNLKLMQTDLDTSRKLSEKIPANFLKISESGITNPEIVQDLKQNYGYHGFLIGEFFMLQADPGKAMADFVSKL